MLYLVYTYLAMFVVFTGVHLYASLIKRDSLRGPTKVVILLAILGVYLEWMHYKGADPSAILVFALLTSWLGDVLLIPKGVKWFTLGGIAFWASHFLFIFAYYKSGVNFAAFSPVWIAVIALVYAVTVCILFRKLKPWLPKPLFYPMFLYLLTNGAMNSFAWFRLLSGSCSLLSGIITGVGALLFFISDCSLFFVRFDKECPIKSHFPVMLTYSIGELLIVLGFMLMV